MNIYDCFMYFDEDLLLDLRLNILNSYVKKFVIVESSNLHSGNKKKLNFDIKNFTKFNAIFDAAAIGQYLGGIDEFNLIDKTKNNTVGFKNETCVVDYSKFEFCWKKTDKLFKPYLKKEGQLIPIINLHIHSKKLFKFTKTIKFFV